MGGNGGPQLLYKWSMFEEKEKKEKDNEIKKLHIEVYELALKLWQCQKSQQKEKRHVFWQASQLR